MTVSQQQLEHFTRDLVAYVEHVLGEKIGVTIFLSTFDERGFAYISNVKRADVIRQVEKWLAHQKAGPTTDPTDPPGPRPEG